MEVEYVPIFLENKKNGIVDSAWIHDDANIDIMILPLAYTSEIGILRLMVSDISIAESVLIKKGFIVRRSSCAVEIVPSSSCGLRDILDGLAEHGIDVELTGIIPGIYQG